LHDSTRNEISIRMLEKLVRINEDKDISLKEERLSVFIFFLFEKEHSHKYVDPNIEKIHRQKFLRLG